MPRNGSGTFNRIYNWTTDAGNGIDIEPSRMDGEFDGLATGLSNSIAKDGQTTITADIPFNSKKITGLANGSARTDSITLGQVQDGTYKTLGTLGGSADTYTATPTPAITAYATGSEFNLKVNADNTGASTLNVSAVAAKNIKKYDGAGAVVDLEAGDLQQDQYYKVIYDGTQFILLNPDLKSNDLTINNKLNIQPNLTTISSGAIAYTGAYMLVDTEGGASQDELTTINGGSDGDILIIKQANDARGITFKHAGGNINLTNGIEFSLRNIRDRITLMYDSAFWVEISRSLDNDFLSNKNQNGYTYLPNGLIFQWGYLTANGTVTFPIAFPNAAINLTFGSFGGENGTPRGNTLTTTSFYYSSANFANTNSFWVAIGH